MRSIILRCPVCKRYTMEASCRACNEVTQNPLPARYSPQDRYGRYRRALMRSKEE